LPKPISSYKHFSNKFQLSELFAKVNKEKLCFLDFKMLLCLNILETRFPLSSFLKKAKRRAFWILHLIKGKEKQC